MVEEIFLKKNVPSSSTGLFCRACLNDSACSLFSCYTTQLFSLILCSSILCCYLENLSTTINLSNFWHRKLRQLITYAFCSWDILIQRKWKFGSPNNLCKCTESPSALSTNTSIEWNLSLSWNKHLATSFWLEMDVGGFSKHQNKLNDTDRCEGFLFTARVSQINLNTIERIFEQRSVL